MSPPLLRLDAARIETGGSPLLDAASLELPGPRAGLLGLGASALFRLLSAEATLASGTAEVLGVDARAAVARNHVGLALADVALPGDLRGVDFLIASARLAGAGLFRSRRVARETLEQLGASTLGPKKIRTMNDTERRALVIAHTVLADPPVVALEKPLSGLDGPAAASIATLIDRVADGRRLLVSADTISVTGPEATLFGSLDAVGVSHGGRWTRIGGAKDLLRPGPRYVVRTLRGAVALAGVLSARGFPVEVEPHESDPDSGGRLVVLLGQDADTAPILDAALEVSAPILDLLPIGTRGP